MFLDLIRHTTRFCTLNNLQEATYPTYVDFQAALRLLRMHKSRKRMSMMRRRRSRQDKYQLKTWDHHIGA